MKKFKIVADSSANVLTLKDIEFGLTPLKIITKDKEFIDDHALDAEDMIRWFDSYTGKSKTSCPSPSDWIDAFGDADEIYCITITSGLSGSYNSACVAKQMYESENIGKRVCVIDSLSAGPELVLFIEKLEEYIKKDMPYDSICREIEKYKQQTGLVFMLQSLKNFAANGRVSPTIAKIAGVLGIRIIGKASDAGTLEPTNKCKGEAGSLKAIVRNLKSAGLSSGKVRIAHCNNENGANELTNLIKHTFPQTDVQIHPCRGLCSYYAEKGGLLVGFEKI